MKDASLRWERWHPLLLPASSGTMHRDGTGRDGTDLGQERHRLHRGLSWGLCPAPFSPQQTAAQEAEEATPWRGHRRYRTFFHLASRSLHFMPWCFGERTQPYTTTAWTELEASKSINRER